jgi:hypothetical protein
MPGWARRGRRSDAEESRTFEEPKRCSPDLCICPLSARTADLDAPGDGGARAGQRQRILWSSRPSRAAVTPRRSWRGFPAGRPDEQGEAIACAAARRRGGHGGGDAGNPRLEPRSGPKPSLASRRRGSISRCKSQVQDLVARERAETPRTGGRMGPGHQAAAPQRCGIARCRT